MHKVDTRRAAGFSLIELLVVVAIIMIIMGMAIPKIQAAKRLALEAGAMKAISTIHVAQAQYQSQYGRFAATMAELGPPVSGRPSVSAAGLIASDLASGAKAGYKYTLVASEFGYTINANPMSFGQTGDHTYFSDECWSSVKTPAWSLRRRPARKSTRDDSRLRVLAPRSKTCPLESGHCRLEARSTEDFLARSALNVRHTMWWRSVRAES